MDHADRPELDGGPAADDVRLEALRAAVKVGLDDLAAGRYLEFADFDALGDFLLQQAEEILARPSS